MKTLGLNGFIVLMVLMNGFTYLFACCYFGKWSTESFHKMGDCLYFDVNWYEYSAYYTKCTLPNLLPRIENCYYEFGNVYYGRFLE